MGTAIKELYNNADHAICVSGRLFGTVFFRNGVKQGCPLAGILYVLATEPLHVALRMHISIRLGITCSYYDDIGMAATSLFVVVVIAVVVFAEFQVVSNLYLNFSKCVLVPLWRFVDSDIRDQLVSIGVAAASFRISCSGKYLGTYLGRDLDEKCWAGPIRAYIEAVQDIRRAMLPLHVAVVLYNVFAYSRLAFVASIRAPTTAVFKLERHWQQLALAGAYYAYPQSFLFFAKSLGFPVEMRPLASASYAARFRVAHRAVPESASLLNSIRLHEWDDEAIINWERKAWLRGLLQQ